MHVTHLCGLVFVAMVHGVKEERKERQRKQEAEAKKLEEAAEVTKNHSVEAMRDAFDACDGDGSGEIDAEELVEVMGAMGEVVTIETCNDIIQNMDQDGNGTLDFAEFVFMMTNGEIKVLFVFCTVSHGLCPFYERCREIRVDTQIRVAFALLFKEAKM